MITAPLLGGSAILLGAGLPDRLAARSAVLLLALTAVIPGGFATGVTSWRGQLDTPAMVRFLGDGAIPDPAQWRGGDAGIGAERTVGEGRDGLLTAWLLSPFDFVIPAPPD